MIEVPPVPARGSAADKRDAGKYNAILQGFHTYLFKQQDIYCTGVGKKAMRFAGMPPAEGKMQR
ncbi:hypothetical protein [Massilia violaceinigra]|uniref:hypothetical protein n=1 Tax=Massilia violaceinigra TaxID=2045208 RepID=UPI0012FE642C|nr:hypothetical protein [Massilia violaceinigra]